MSRLRLPLVLALFVAALAPALRGFVFIEGMPAWPDGTVTLHLQLGTTPGYYDGTTPNSTAIEALQSWNPYMGRIQLNYVDASDATISRTNGLSNVFFNDTVYGSTFGDGVLAVTVSRWTSGSGPIEADVVVNSARSWNSYRGPLWSGETDLRRVLAHEFGHVLGLDHPDEHGQSWIALMNSHVSFVEAPVFDDQEGAAARYGRGTANPATAPTFTQHPFSTSATEGDTVYFSAYTSGTSPMSYRWAKDGVDLTVATADTAYLTLVSVKPTDSGTYTLRATNEVGSATSNGATLTVAAPAPPVFAAHPQSQTIAPGDSLYLSAYATSNVQISYQWTRDGVNIDGAISTELTIHGATAGTAGVYRLVASTVAGSATSEPATIVVVPANPPVFDIQPTDRSAIEGEQVTFIAHATSSAPLTYHWTENGTPIPNSNTSVLAVTPTSQSNGATIRCVATNAGGSVESNPATLRVNPLPPPPRTSLPNVNAQVGSFVTFYADGSGFLGQVTYRWYHNGVLIPGANSAGLTIKDIQVSDAGEYFAVLTNASGSSTSAPGIITVVGPVAVPTGGWRQAINDAGVGYFLFDSPARIERFDFAAEAWLPPLSLSHTPTHMAIMSTGSAVVAYGRTLIRVDLTTGTESPMLALDVDLHDMAVHNGRLYMIGSDPTSASNRRLGSVSLLTPDTPVWSIGSSDIGTGLSIDHAHDKAFCLSTASFRPDISMVPILPDGSPGSRTDSPYVDLFAIGTRTWVNPAGSLVFDNAGTVYATADLSYAGTVGGTFQSLAFAGDGSPLILRGQFVTVYDALINQTGTVALTRSADHIAAYGHKIYAFNQPSSSGSTIDWERKALDEMVAPEPLPEVSPATLDFIPDEVLIDRDGTILLYSQVHGNVLRWSTKEQRFLQPIRLIGRPTAVAYSPETHRLNLGYADGHIRTVDLATSNAEAELAAVPGRISGMCDAGNHLLVTGSKDSSWTFSRILYSATGARSATLNDTVHGATMVWDPRRQRVYDIHTNGLSYTEVTPAGEFGASRDSPFSPNEVKHPRICLSPSADVILTGSGRLFHSDTLESSSQLPYYLTDAAWLGSSLYTIRDTFAGAMIERLGGSSYSKQAELLLSGHAFRLFACGERRLVAITTRAGRTHFTLLDADLNVRNHFEDTPDLTKVALTNLSTRAEVGTGDNIIIAGFVVTGSQSKRILVRAVGPELKRFGVSDTLADPVLTVINASDEVVAENDNWSTPDGDALKLAFKEVFAFGLADNSLDSALVAQLVPGKYTAQVSGKDGGQGVALVEAYDLDADPGERRLINISTRAVVGIGDKVLIPGLAVEGTEPKRLLIRAVGPELARFGVGGVLADPNLRVVNADEEVVAANDNWGDDNTEVTSAATAAAKAFRLTAGGRDAALVVTLPPGSYTVVVAGVGDTSGVALVEIYEVP